MTYIAHLDPNSAERVAFEDYCLAWDDEFPDWEELSIDPEQRDTIAYNDVENPEDGVVFRRYGSDDPGRWYPGASGEYIP